jgi:hypothetical protein
MKAEKDNNNFEICCFVEGQKIWEQAFVITFIGIRD